MSHVSLKELELVGLKNQNKNLESLALKREQERKSQEAKCQELQNKNDKLMKQVTCKLPVQGAKHIFWDIVAITQITKLLIIHIKNHIIIKETKDKDSRLNNNFILHNNTCGFIHTSKPNRFHIWCNKLYIWLQNS